MCKESQSPNPENAVPVTACRSKNANPSLYCLWPMTSLGGTAWGFHGGMRHREDADCHAQYDEDVVAEEETLDPEAAV